MNNETELAKARNRAEALHALLAKRHPDRSNYLQSLIIKVDRPRAERLQRLHDYLAQYDVSNTNAKPSKNWDAQLNILKRKAQDYVTEQGKAPRDTPRFLEYLIDHLEREDNKILRVLFNMSSQSRELSYDAVYARVTKRFNDKSLKVPQNARDLHDFTHGNLSRVNAWLKTADSIVSSKGFRDKFVSHVENQQLHAVSRLIRRLEAGGIDTSQNLTPHTNRFTSYLYGMSIKSLRIHNRRSGEKHSFLPLKFKDFMSAKEIHSSMYLYDLARRVALPLIMIVGAAPALEEDYLKDKFNKETYKKIRNFLAYEYENVLTLNRAAAMMTLIFPDYNDFTTYVTKKATYNPDTQKLDLDKLIDISRFDYDDRDYAGWSAALLDRGPVINFYIKNADLLDEIPKNEKGALKISDIDFHLYKNITQLVDVTTKMDILKYENLKIVRDVKDIKDFNSACHKATKGQILSRTTRNVPPIQVDGARFQRPDLQFNFLPYDSPYFPIIGRFTDSCERAGGDYEDTLLQAYLTRKTGVWCIFNEQNEPIAHTLIERQQDGCLLIKGFEGQNSINKALLEQVVAEIRKDLPHETFIVGTSSLRIGYQEVMTVDRAELEPGHKVKVDPTKIFNMRRFVESIPKPPSGIRHLTKIDDAVVTEIIIPKPLKAPKEP